MIPASEYLRVLRSHIVVLCVAALFGGLLGYAAGTRMPRTYSSDVYIAVQVLSAPDPATLLNAGTLINAQALALASLAPAEPTVVEAVQRAGMPATRAGEFDVKATNPAGTSYVHVTVKGKSGPETAQVAEWLSQVLGELTTRLSPKTQSGTKVLGAARVAEPTVPEKPEGISSVTVALGGAIALAMAAYALFLLRDLSRRRIHDPHELKQLVGDRYFGEMDLSARAAGPSVASVADDARTVVARMGWAEASTEGHAAVVVQVGETPTRRSTARSLAVAMSELHRSVLLIESPTGEALEGAAPRPSLSDVVAEPSRIDEAIAQGPDGLYLLSGGAEDPGQLATVRSPAARLLLQRLRSGFDVVLIDTSGHPSVATALAFADLTEGAVVSVVKGDARPAETTELVDALGPERLLSVVLVHA